MLTFPNVVDGLNFCLKMQREVKGSSKTIPQELELDPELEDVYVIMGLAKCGSNNFVGRPREILLP